MKLLQDLINIPSISNNEERLAGFIQSYCKKNGIKTINHKGNIFVEVKGLSHDKCLIFNAHMDTVSPGEVKFWKSHPTHSYIKDGRVYGLGASDDKAGIVALLHVIIMLKDKKPQTDIFFTFTTSEETDGSGTKEFVNYFRSIYAKKYKKIFAIVCESTDAKTLELGHRGDIKIQITTFGESGHASAKNSVKSNAIENTLQAIKKVKALEFSLFEKSFDTKLGHTTLTLTGINSNVESINKIPNKCITTWDIRTTPKYHKKIQELLIQTLGRTSKVEKLFKNSSNPVIISENEAIVTLFKKVYPNIKTSVSPGSNDTCFFIEAGISAVSFGPGTKSAIHKENEYVEVKNIQKTVKIYKEVIDNF